MYRAGSGRQLTMAESLHIATDTTLSARPSPRPLANLPPQPTMLDFIPHTSVVSDTHALQRSTRSRSVHAKLDSMQRDVNTLIGLLGKTPRVAEVSEHPKQPWPSHP